MRWFGPLNFKYICNIIFSNIWRGLFYVLFFTPLFLFPKEDPLKDYRAGVALLKMKKYNDAEKTFARFIRKNPFEYQVRNATFYRAEALRQNKKFLEAISQYNIVQRRYKIFRYRVIVNFRLAECYYRLENLSRARIYFKTYLELAQQFELQHFAHVYLGEIYEKSNQWEKAVESYQKALESIEEMQNKKDPNFNTLKINKLKASLYRRLGLMYAIRFKDRKIAYMFLQNSLKSGKKLSRKIQFVLRKITLVHLNRGNGLPDNSIADIVVDGDDVYIATWNDGLLRFTRSSEKIEKIKLPSPQIRNIFVDFDKIYICTFDGIYLISKKSGQVFEITSDGSFRLAQKIIKDDRYLYFSTLERGLLRFDVYKKKLVKYGVDSFVGTNAVYSIDADVEHLAVGTISKGVLVLNKKTNTVLKFNKAQGNFAGNNIKTVLLDGRYIWVGVHKYGVYRCDLRLEKCRRFDWDTPYPTAMTKRGKEIWIGTSGNGIRIYDQQKGSLTRLTVIEGLSSNEIHHIEPEGDFIWLGYLDAGIDILYRPEEEP